MSLEGNAITEYASLSGKIHTLVIDKTLSISGACADAKVVGDKIEPLEDCVKEAKELYEDAIAGMEETAGEIAGKAAKEAVDALTAGDVGAYTKEEIWTASLKEAYGLGQDAVPSAALSLLSRFQSGLGNEYVWAKYAMETTTVYDATTGQSDQVNTNASDFYYSASFHIADGLFVLDNPTLISWLYPDDLSDLTGKYCIKGGTATSGDTLYLMVELPTKYSTAINCANITVYSNIHNEDVRTLVGYVNSPDPAAYPVDDGYTYTALGQIGNKVQIATVSYVGTGTFGESNPNSLTFDFTPKAWGIYAKRNGISYFYSYGLCVYPWGVDCAWSSMRPDSYNSPCSLTMTYSGNTVNWYSTSVDNQLNTSGWEFDVIAIG